MRWLLPILCLLAGSACSPCSQSCRQEAAAFDECLDGWGLGWADLGARDRNDFRDQCIVDNKSYVRSLDTELRRAEEGLCADLAHSLRIANDCDSAWAALTEYGLAP
ncbi:MAG: hypothetical protein CL928_03750 [Deltaproteobacteria bacterium]|nr:hypothetical protein [Deltaproteobacteria bacterium]